MDFLEIVKTRYSCRKYKGQKVEKEKVEKILEAAHVAPSAANQQPISLIVVQEKNMLDKISKTTNLYNAPLAIIICGDTDKAWTNPYNGKKSTDIDASIITDHMMLEATNLGLNSVWIGWFDPSVIMNEFNIPKNKEVINILAIGYGNDSPLSKDRHSSTRKPLSQLVSYDHI